MGTTADELAPTQFGERVFNSTVLVIAGQTTPVIQPANDNVIFSLVQIDLSFGQLFDLIQGEFNLVTSDDSTLLRAFFIDSEVEQNKTIRFPFNGWYPTIAKSLGDPVPYFTPLWGRGMSLQAFYTDAGVVQATVYWRYWPKPGYEGALF